MKQVQSVILVILFFIYSKVYQQSEEIPDFYDVRDQYPECDYFIYNQGRAGICYAISVASTVSYRYCMTYGINKQLSVQQIVSCSFEDSGIYGGVPSNAFQYIVENGIVSSDCFPYTTNDFQRGKCLILKDIENHQPIVKSCSTHKKYTDFLEDNRKEIDIQEWGLKYFVTNFSHRNYDYEEIKEELYRNGPVSMGINLPDNIVDGTYVDGLTPKKRCSSSHHAVVYVGFGIYEGWYYFLVANSFGEDWGEDGFFKLKGCASDGYSVARFCENGTFYSSGFCLKSHPDCLSSIGPNSDDCELCANGKYVQLEHYYDVVGPCIDTCPTEKHFINNMQCTPCHPKCATCKSRGKCTSCEDSDHYLLAWVEASSDTLLLVADGYCIDFCPDGYFLKEFNGITYCLNCSDSCLTCSGLETQCTSCSSVLLKEEGQEYGECLSFCPDGYSKVNQVCVLCPDNCETCSDNETCTSCSDSFYLYKKLCYEECPNNSIANETTMSCSHCNSACSYCGDYGCLECLEGYYLLLHNRSTSYGECSGTLLEGYYIRSEGAMSGYPCDSSCKECTSYPSTHCTSCYDNYYLYEISSGIGKCQNECDSSLGYTISVNSEGVTVCSSPKSEDNAESQFFLLGAFIFVFLIVAVIIIIVCTKKYFQLQKIKLDSQAKKTKTKNSKIKTPSKSKTKTKKTRKYSKNKRKSKYQSAGTGEVATTDTV